MKKYQGKRFIVFGSPPNGGGWSDYCVEQDTLKKARVEAWHWLNAGYNSHILDQKTNKQWDVRLTK